MKSRCVSALRVENCVGLPSFITERFQFARKFSISLPLLLHTGDPQSRFQALKSPFSNMVEWNELIIL